MPVADRDERLGVVGYGVARRLRLGVRLGVGWAARRRLPAVTWRAGAAALIVAATAAPAWSTTLVVLVSRRAIVIAADSLRTLAGGGTEAVCKIHDERGVVYGFAGAVSSDRFDATRIARQELAGPGDLAQQARRIADALQAGLVEHFRTHPVDRTRRELVDGQRGRPVTGFVASLIDGKPQGFLILVLADGEGAGVTLRTQVEPLDTVGRDRAIFLSSQHQAVIDRATTTVSRREHASVDDLIAAATDLVTLDLTLEGARPAADRRSGPPVAVAVLERGVFRFAAPGVCGPSPGGRRAPANR